MEHVVKDKYVFIYVEENNQRISRKLQEFRHFWIGMNLAEEQVVETIMQSWI